MSRPTEPLRAASLLVARIETLHANKLPLNSKGFFKELEYLRQDSLHLRELLAGHNPHG